MWSPIPARMTSSFRHHHHSQHHHHHQLKQQREEDSSAAAYYAAQQSPRVYDDDARSFRHVHGSTSSSVGSPSVTDGSSGVDRDSWSAGPQMIGPPPASRPRIDEELCLICGDRASGYHYNALSCEGCKGFFRRSITRNAQYACKYGGNCEMDMWMRRKCQACRLRQCRMVGMKEECLLSERQCIARNARRQTKPKAHHNKPQHRGGVVAVKSTSIVPRSLTPTMIVDIEDCRTPTCRTPLDMLSDEHRELVSRIVSYQDKYDLPSPEDIARVAEMNIAKSFVVSSASDAIFGHMVEMTILVTRLVVEFAKHLPGFQNLSKGDQIAMLKGSASEVMMLRTARRYDPETNTVVFGDGTPFSSTSMAFGGLQGFVDGMFEFSRGMSTLAVDNAEYALLTALCIFSDRPGISDMAAIQHIQEVYSDALFAYVKNRRICGSHFLAKLLMKLVELRTLSDEHSKCLYRLTIEKGSLPPLLREYFDIPEQAP